jgi:hypothetical protein
MLPKPDDGEKIGWVRSNPAGQAGKRYRSLQLSAPLYAQLDVNYAEIVTQLRAVQASIQ